MGAPLEGDIHAEGVQPLKRIVEPKRRRFGSQPPFTLCFSQRSNPLKYTRACVILARAMRRSGSVYRSAGFSAADRLRLIPLAGTMLIFQNRMSPCDRRGYGALGRSSFQVWP